MANQKRLDEMYMRQAYNAAELSHATRKKVGAMLVIQNEGRFEGVNGTPSGFDNNPEFLAHHDWAFIVDDTYECRFCKEIRNRKDAMAAVGPCPLNLKTKDICLHAESNAIMKVACSHASSIGGTMYCTLTPCLECAKLIIQAKITRVVYSEQYPYATHTGVERPLGLKLLEDAGIVVDQLDMTGTLCHYDMRQPHAHQDEGLHNATEDLYNSYE